jgi:branched-chain amino acid transport system substrate-binding protein
VTKRKTVSALLIAAGVAAVASTATLGASTRASQPAKASAALAPIVIGMQTDESGPLASNGRSYAPGVKAWVAWVNARGGILGHKVVLISRDSKSDPTTALATAKELIGAKKAVVFIPGAAQGAAAIAGYITSQKIAAVGGYKTDPTWDTNPWVFAHGLTALEAVKMLPYLAKLAGKTKGAVPYCAEVAACAGSVPLLKDGATKAGGQIVSSLSVAASSPDLTAACLTMQGQGADYVIPSLADAQAARLATDCAKNNYRPLYTLPNISSIQLQTPALDGASFGLHWPISTGAKAAQFRAAMNKYQSKFVKDPSFGEITLGAWVGGLLIQRAIEAANPKGAVVTRNDVLRGLWKLKNETLGGTSVPLTFVKGKPNPVGCFFRAVVKSGKLVQQSATAVCNPK